jgi:uncharacterized protein (DUF2336 family)
MECITAERSAADRKLLRAIVAQFLQGKGHAPGDALQFERLVGALLERVDDETAASVAQALCRHPETPPALVRRLFDRGGAAERIAFEFAPTAPAAELLANAQHGPAEIAAAIARRPDLSPEAVAAIAARRESVVLHALASNRKLALDGSSLRAMIEVARDDLTLARLLLDREDSDADRGPLFLAATTQERNAIMLSATGAALAASESDVAHCPDAVLAAQLEALAAARDHDALVARVANALDARKGRVRNILFDQGGEALALTFVALSIDMEAATRILLRSGLPVSFDTPRMRALRALMRATSRRAAEQIVAAITGGALAQDEAAPEEAATLACAS